MSTRVLLLRHGESADPTVFHGAESDIGLSERGRRQAEAVAPVLAALMATRLVSSAMRRARETTVPIARACGLVPRIEPNLHERRVGQLAGMPTSGEVWPDTLRRWMTGDTGFAPDGAESFDAIRGRVMRVWDRVIAEYAGETIAIVAHGVVIKVLLLSLVAGYSVADWKRIGPIRNVGITELRREPETWRLVRLNELPPEVAAVNEESNPS
jgi:probable phosphoglycerate mutase